MTSAEHKEEAKIRQQRGGGGVTSSYDAAIASSLLVITIIITSLLWFLVSRGSVHVAFQLSSPCFLVHASPRLQRKRTVHTACTGVLV